MKKNMKKFEKKTLKVNETNDIDSIIEIFQRFGNEYEVKITKLDDNIQYQTKNTKITQSHTSTISQTDTDKMINKLKKQQGKITLIIIEDTKRNNHTEVKKKINILNNLENVTAKIIKKKDTFNVLDKLIKEA
ncbi:MAG TPA: hypothetical protein HA277_07065 [Methanosphaera sp.]|nr:hypothetical protein [Methanosphaera sp.]